MSLDKAIKYGKEKENLTQKQKPFVEVVAIMEVVLGVKAID